VVVVRAIVFAFLLVAQLGAEAPAALYRQAVDRQRAGDLAGAVQLYRECLEQEPSNFQARSNLGAALSGLERYDEAIREYEAALTSAPETLVPLLRRNIGLAYYKSGRMDAASRIFSDLHAAHPGDRDTSLLAADCLVQLGQPAKAVDLLRPVRASSGQDRAVAYLFGIALLKSGNAEEAQSVLDPILSDPNSAEGNFAIGMSMFMRQDYPAAVKAFGRAAELNPALPRVYSYYGQTLLFTGDSKAASEAFSKQLASDANDYEASFRMAQILASRGQFTDATPLFQRAVLLRPESREARSELADALAGTFKRKGPGDAGVPLGALAPVVEVERMNGAGRVQLPAVERGRPAVLIFGSYTCPFFRSAAPVLEKLSAQYSSQAAFLLVYIREAHAGDQWQSTINEREHISLTPAANRDQKNEHAQMCVRNLRLSFPAAVDGMDGAAEKAYSAWPSRVYVVRPDGRVGYASALNDFEFDAKALEAAIEESVKESLR
jgi:tetratricopeptide (TPR) repeat protein